MEIVQKNNAGFFIYRERLGPYVKISFIIHFLFLLLLIFFPKNFGLFQPKTKITTIVPAIRVDVVGMPKMTVQELKNLTTGGGQGSVETEKEDDVSTFKKPGRKLSDILKSEAKKDLSLGSEKLKFSGKGKGKFKGDLSKLVLEGNKISKGMAIIGDTRAMVMGPFGQYVSMIPDYVRVNWKLPPALLNSSLNCRIRIFLNSDGKLIKAEMFESSGNQDYDRRAMQAVMNSSYPKPDKEIIDKVLDGNILLGFPL